VTHSTIALLAAWILSTVGAAHAEPYVNFAILPGSHLSLIGKASFVTWRLTSERVEGSISIGAPPHIVETILSDWSQNCWLGDSLEDLELPAKALISIPVTSLENRNEGMVRDVRRALKAEAFPSIHFEFLEVEEIQITAMDQEEARLKMRTKGVLSVSGHNRIVSLNVTAKRPASGMIHLSGITQIRMSDFNIDPPTRLFGLIRANDDVVIEFQLYVDSSSSLPLERAENDPAQPALSNRAPSALAGR
jgi:polyisoprenoid-binding protein YceI